LQAASKKLAKEQQKQKDAYEKLLAKASASSA
jgi:hypothetical protein